MGKWFCVVLCCVLFVLPIQAIAEYKPLLMLLICACMVWAMDVFE